jgi:hypothetical protein
MLSEASLINSPHCVVAVDPGLSGAILKLGRGVFTLYRDFKSPAQIALAVQALTTGDIMPDLVAVEAVHAFPGQGVVSVWSFAEATAYAKAALCLCAPSARPLEPQPQAWQKWAREFFEVSRSEEFDSRTLATNLFPSYASMFKRVKDHNSADACLIGAWALQLASNFPTPKLPPAA